MCTPDSSKPWFGEMSLWLREPHSADASARASRDARARAYLDVTVPFFARAFARLIGDSSDFRFAASDLARDAFTDVASSA